MHAGKACRALVILALLAVTLVAAGCNTVHGAGKDIERAGEVLEGK
jgi:predicted small secreted protein